MGKAYLKFRHLSGYLYGFELKWERFKGLCIKLEDILSNLRFEVESFLKEVAKND